MGWLVVRQAGSSASVHGSFCAQTVHPYSYTYWAIIVHILYGCGQLVYPVQLGASVPCTAGGLVYPVQLGAASVPCTAGGG